MKTYNLAEAAALLGVDLATLRRWRVRAGGVGARGAADRRRVWLTRAELAGLARAHGRVLVDAAVCPLSVSDEQLERCSFCPRRKESPIADVAGLAREVAELAARVALLESVVSVQGYTE